MRIKTCQAGLLALSLLVPTLAGATTSFDPAENANLHTIALTGFDEPEFTAYCPNPNRSRHDSIIVPAGSFQSLTTQQGLHFAAELKDAIAQALRADGYEIVDGPADAELTAKTFGITTQKPRYATRGLSGDCEPQITISVTLTDAKSGSTLFHRLYLYVDSWVSPWDGSLKFTPDPKYTFKLYHDIFADIPRAIEAIRALEPLVAQSVGESLKKP
jgi:hypothetical protein